MYLLKVASGAVQYLHACSGLFLKSRKQNRLAIVYSKEPRAIRSLGLYNTSYWVEQVLTLHRLRLSCHDASAMPVV